MSFLAGRGGRVILNAPLSYPPFCAEMWEAKGVALRVFTSEGGRR